MKTPHMTARQRLGALLALLVVAAVVAGVLVFSDDSSPKRPPRPFQIGATAVQHARQGCQEVAEVQAEVKADGDKDRVFAYLDAARQELAAAASAEPIWLSLQSGVESINRGLRRDDADASALGIAIARDQCRRAGVFLPGAVR